VRHDESIPVNIDTGGANKSDAPPLPKNRPRAYLHVDPFRARALFIVRLHSPGGLPFLPYMPAVVSSANPAGKKSIGAPCGLIRFSSIEQTSFPPLILSREQGERATRLRRILCSMHDAFRQRAILRISIFNCYLLLAYQVCQRKRTSSDK
jgi:hypothetical protein